MSTNIQVPNYPQAHVQQIHPQQIQTQYNHEQQYSQHVQQIQPQQVQQIQPQQVQQVHYDNFNQIVNINKPVTFVADGISLDIMKECDPIHINTLINMGIKLAKDHSFYKQFLVNKDNYNLKGSTISSEESSNNNHSNVGSHIGNVGNVGNTTQPMQQNVQMQPSVPASKVQDSLDFTKLFD